jgi:alkylation response protein AidB-like acyl-CoA dehydrogenase
MNLTITTRQALTGAFAVALLSFGLAVATAQQPAQPTPAPSGPPGLSPIDKSNPATSQQGVSFKLADMALEIELARVFVYKVAWMAEQKEKIAKEAAMAKLFASEMVTRVAHKALQIHGGYGFSKEFPLERFYRDARIFEIFQGTSEINRVIIAGQLGL